MLKIVKVLLDTETESGVSITQTGPSTFQVEEVYPYGGTFLYLDTYETIEAAEAAARDMVAMGIID